MRLRPAPFYLDVAGGPENVSAYWVHSDDDIRIRIAMWTVEKAKGTVLMFPGRTEYVEKYARTAGALAARGYAMLAIDWRGQGLADRLVDDVNAGHVENFPDYQRDMRAAIEAARSQGLPEPYFLLGHSMGGCIGLRALMDGLPVRAAAFTGPMWGILMSALMRPAAWALSWASSRTGVGPQYAPGTRAKTYVLDEPFEGNTLTTDPEMYRYMQDQARSYPQLVIGGPSMHWLHEALREMRGLSRRPSPEIPCLAYLGAQEQIVDPASIRDRMARWPGSTLRDVAECEHEVLMEAPGIRDKVRAEICDFFDGHL